MNQERIYHLLYLIRRAEEEVVRIYPSDKIKSPVHLSIGQEAVSVGVCQALQAEDVVFGTYRSHALYLAKTGDLKGFFAELYGKATGCAKGKGGSMHLANVSKGMMGTSAVVGTTIPQAVGYAYAVKQRGEKTVVVPVSDTYKKIYARLKKEFGDSLEPYLNSASHLNAVQVGNIVGWFEWSTLI